MNYSQAHNLRYMLAFSLLSGKEISLFSQDPFESYELAFIELLTRVTVGSKAILSKGNRKLDFRPGSIESSDEEVSFDCGKQRAVSYFLEPLFLILPFAKRRMVVRLEGITNDSVDLDIDSIKDALLPFLALALKGGANFDLKVVRRAFRPSAGGLIFFTVDPTVKTLPKIVVNSKPIKRVRGIAVASKVSTSFLNRMISSAREVLNDYIPDVWIYSEIVKHNPDNFYGISLSSDTFLTSGCCFDPMADKESGLAPEQLGATAALRLVDDALFGSGIVSTSFQSLVFSLMALTEGQSVIVIGRVSDHAVTTLRLIKDFFGVSFLFADVEAKQYAEDEEQENQVSSVVKAGCHGIALRNRFRETS